MVEQYNLVGQVYCIFSMGKLLIICNVTFAMYMHIIQLFTLYIHTRLVYISYTESVQFLIVLYMVISYIVIVCDDVSTRASMVNSKLNDQFLAEGGW